MSPGYKFGTHNHGWWHHTVPLQKPNPDYPESIRMLHTKFGSCQLKTVAVPYDQRNRHTDIEAHSVINV